MPANPVKLKKLAKAAEMTKNDTGNNDRKKSQEIRKEETTTKWYMGVYGDDENDVLMLFSHDSMTDSWIYLPEIDISQIKKELISFQISRPLQKFVVLRCSIGLPESEARKLIYALEEQLTVRSVRFVLYQSPTDHSDITVHCVSCQRFDDVYEELYVDGWKFHGSSGPPASKNIMLKEGSVFEIGFRGNVKFDEKYYSPGKKLFKYYNSQLPCQVNFTVTEADRYLQRNYDSYKGLCMVSAADKSQAVDTTLNATSRSRSSTGSLNTKKASSIMSHEKRRLLCELPIQLAKDGSRRPKIPPMGKFCFNLKPIYIEAMDMLTVKLGKEWEALGKVLGLSDGRLEAIKSRNKEHPDDCKADMLYTWMKRQPRSSNRLPKLYHALMSCGRIDLAYKIEDLYCSSDDAPVEIIITHDGNIPACVSGLNDVKQHISGEVDDRDTNSEDQIIANPS